MHNDQPTRTALRSGALGANFNESWDVLDYADLELAGARWVRGFVTIAPPTAQEGGQRVAPAEGALGPTPEAGVEAALGALRRGYRVIFTLKFAYAAQRFPSPGSPELAAVLRQVDALLERVMGQVEVVEIGNEPFIESLPDDRGDALNTFYEIVANHVVAFRAARYPSGCPTRLYLGALNRIDLPQNRTPTTDRWLRYARETSEIEGIDLHPHVASLDAARAFLDYAIPRLRADQSFLATEFSLVWRWQQHLDDAAPSGFCAEYGFSAGTSVWEVIGAAIDAPFEQAAWDAFTAQCAWFAEQRDYLSEQLAMFRNTGRLAVATYGFRQIPSMTRDWGPAKVPWLLNSVFAPLTVASGDDGTSGRTRQWFEDFRALQNGC